METSSNMSFILRRFNPDTDIQKPFDCGDKNLNDFLLKTAGNRLNAFCHEKELLSVTYVIENAEEHSIVAYFSLLHDKIERDFADGAIWNRMSRRIPNAKRKSSYPALKIGRLAVRKSAQSAGIGTRIIQFVEAEYLENRKAGCRFITVDALLSAEPFYRKCSFDVLVPPESDDQTVLMFLDLKRIAG